MHTLLAAAVKYGGYVSVVKLIVYVAMFYAWMPMVNWVFADAQAVRTKKVFWTGITAGIGAATLTIWLLAPLFAIGILLHLIALGAITIVYVIHRNSLVADFEKVLTVQHIKGIFVDEQKKIKTVSKGMGFVTANGNDVPLPKPKTPEAFGFKTACDLFNDALWKRVSDIILRPSQKEYTLIYRIDGVATKQDPKSRKEVDFFINYLKQLADLDTSEKRKPQTGRFEVSKNDEKSEWETTTAGSTAGEQIRIRKLEEYNLMKIPDLGLDPEQAQAIERLREMKRGLVIISGPKKSGITSTFYAVLRNHDPFMNNINTLEIQPAAELQNVTQKVFSMADSGTTTYAKRLQSILRMGPDIMGVADCQDKNCAKLVSAAVKDGKVMHVTMESDSAIAALGKWLKFVPDKNMVADTLVAIINQRLVRKLCSDCKQAYQPNQELFRKFNIPADKIKVLYRAGEVEHDKRGKPILCGKCQGSGYYGRIGIFETVMINNDIRNAIKQAKTLQEISSQIRRSGARFMQAQAIKAVATGVTSINEVVRELSVSKKPEKKKK